MQRVICFNFMMRLDNKQISLIDEMYIITYNCNLFEVQQEIKKEKKINKNYLVDYRKFYLTNLFNIILFLVFVILLSDQHIYDVLLFHHITNLLGKKKSKFIFLKFYMINEI